MIELLFPYILTLHISTVIIALCLIVKADMLALSWIRGKSETLSFTKIYKLHTYTWYALCMLITTGILLFYPYNEYLLSHPPFLIKMGFVFTLIINGGFIGILMHTAIEKPFRTIRPKEKATLLLSGVLSTICWLGAIITATMLEL